MKKPAIKVWKTVPTRNQFPDGYFLFRGSTGSDSGEGCFYIYRRVGTFKGFTFTAQFYSARLAKIAIVALAEEAKCAVSRNEPKAQK